jgi:hypothetical protein
VRPAAGGAQDPAVGLDRAALEGLRQMILAGAARQLAVGDLGDDDLAGLAWSGNPAHLRSVAAALQRAGQGREDYLVVRARGGQPVAKMRVDYTSEAGTGVFSQLAVMGPLQAWVSRRCSSAPASTACVPAAWPSPRSASRKTIRGRAASTNGSDTRRPAASTHHGNTKTTTAHFGCT